MTIWRSVEDALEQIIDDYEKVNHIISLYQDDRTRFKALELIGKSDSICLELGSGPGNFSKMLFSVNYGPIVCLDYSNKMHIASKKRNQLCDLNYIRAIFEALPFRTNIFGLVTAAYSLRDSTNKMKVITEAVSVILPGGTVLIIDIGKPDNHIIQGFMKIYLKHFVPIMGGISTKYGFRNPWQLLYNTFEILPNNKTLKEMLSINLGDEVLVKESIFGAMIIVIGIKANDV